LFMLYASGRFNHCLFSLYRYKLWPLTVMRKKKSYLKSRLA
jgi:hypothetical protein